MPNYFEPAFIIAAITIIIYCISYYYNEAYFAKISFPHSAYNIPRSFYLPQMLGIVSINLIILIITFISSNKSPVDILQTSIGSVSLIAVILTIIFRSISNSARPLILGTNIGWTAPAIQLIFFFTIFVYCLYYRVTITHIYFMDFAVGPFILFITLLMFSLSLASILGDYSAERLVHGGVGIYEIELMLSDQSIEEILNISGKTLILLMQSDGNYYVIEKLNDANFAKNQPLYTVPGNQVKGAIINRRSSSSWGLHQYIENYMKYLLKSLFKAR